MSENDKEIERIRKVMKALKNLNPDDDEGWRKTMDEVRQLVGMKSTNVENVEETLLKIADFANRMESFDSVVDQKIIDKLINAKRDSDKRHIKKGSIGCFHRIDPEEGD